VATLTQAADRHTAVTTGWTNPGNAFAAAGDNVYATAAPAKNATVNGDFGFPALSLPPGSTIQAVRLVVEWGMTAAVNGGTLGVQGRNNNVADSAAEVTQTSTAEAQSTFAFGTLPSLADLKTAGRVVGRVRCSKGNTNTAMTGQLDFVRLEVDYTPPTANQALETDLAQPITRAKSKQIGQASEQDAARPVARLLPPVSANFEAGTLGATIATTDPGGATPFDVVTVGVGQALVYGGEHPARGSLSAKVTQTGSGAVSRAGWTTRFGRRLEHTGRVYLYLTALPTGDSIRFAQITSGGVLVVELQILTTGVVRAIRSGAFVDTSSTVATGQLIRIEYRIVHDTVNGQVEIKLFNSPDSTTPTETATSPANKDTGAYADAVYFGNNGGAAAATWWLDEVYAGGTSYPGPAPATTVGQALETDAAQPVSRSKLRTIGQATETSLAQTITKASGHTVTVGQAAETDVAEPFTARKTRTIGQPAEASTAQPAGRVKARTIGQTAETSSSQPVTRSKRRTLGQPLETSTSQPATRRKTRAVGQPVETDTAQQVRPAHARTIGQATETDSALAATHRKARTLGQALETSLARLTGRIKTRPAGQAAETDTSQPVSSSGHILTVGQTVDTQTAQPVGRSKTHAAGQAAETDTGQPIRPAHSKTIGQAAETQLATALGRAKRLLVGLATETSAALTAVAAKLRPAGQATETDLAQTVTVAGLVVPGTVTLASRARTELTLSTRAATVTLGTRPLAELGLGSRRT